MLNKPQGTKMMQKKKHKAQVDGRAKAHIVHSLRNTTSQLLPHGESRTAEVDDLSVQKPKGSCF